MITSLVHIHLPTAAFDAAACTKGTWLALLHARRLPPHVGLMINSHYSSLTIKGHELDIVFEAVHKTIIQKKIETVFIKVASHPVFSADYQRQVLHEMIRAFPAVKEHEATCLSPIKEFFQEFYAVKAKPEELLFEFIERLAQNNYLELAMACNFELTEDLELPYYTPELLNETIRQQRAPFYNP